MKHTRLPHLDGLRALAFSAVFLKHAFHIQMLWVGVDVFFVLSGFLITSILRQSREQPDYFRGFYWRRTLRIFPPYYLFLIVYFVVFDPANIGKIWVYASYLTNFNEAFYWFVPVPSLSVMWSLAIEEQFYLLWPLVVFLFDRKGLLRICVLLMALAPLARFAFGYLDAQLMPAYFLTPGRMDLLAAGALMAVLRETSSEKDFRRWTGYAPLLGIACAIAFMGLALTFPDFRTTLNRPLFNVVGFSLVLGMAVSVVGFLIPRGSSLIGRLLSSRPLVFLGSISYVCYLIHHFILFRVELLQLSPLQTAVVAYGLTLMVATASWHLLERPLQRFRLATRQPQLS